MVAQTFRAMESSPPSICSTVPVCVCIRGITTRSLAGDDPVAQALSWQEQATVCTQTSMAKRASLSTTTLSAHRGGSLDPGAAGWWRPLRQNGLTTCCQGLDRVGLGTVAIERPIWC